MMARKMLVLLTVVVFSLGTASLGISAGMGNDVKGTVTKIEGGKVTIKDSMGVEQTVAPKNPEALNNVKVGDQASVKDGMLTKEGAAAPPAPSGGGGY